MFVENGREYQVPTESIVKYGGQAINYAQQNPQQAAAALNYASAYGQQAGAYAVNNNIPQQFAQQQFAQQQQYAQQSIYGQPPPQNGSGLVPINRRPPGTVNPAINGRWSDHLCNCLSSPGSCITAFLFPCILFGMNMQRIGAMNCCKASLLYFLPWVIAFAFIAIVSVLGFGIGAWLALFAFLAIGSFAGYWRSEMRKIYNIGGNCILDSLIHTFCTWLAIAQESRQLERDIPLQV